MRPPRPSWSDLPDGVRTAVEDLLGSAVVAWESQQGGFSPGTADRVGLADGRRAFVKAASSAANPDTPGIHRREAGVLAVLPPAVPAPRLLGCVEVESDGATWVALATTEAPGSSPPLPWRETDLEAVLRAAEAVGAVAAPAVLPAFGELHGEDFAGFERLGDGPGPRLDPWTAARVDELAERARRGVVALGGDGLCHCDLRADNVVLDGAEVVVVDWPWAVRAAPWADALFVLVNGALEGGHDPEAWLRRSPVLRAVPPEEVTGALAGLAGFFVDVARWPAPSGLPTVRDFQRRQAGVVLAWLRRRLDP